MPITDCSILILEDEPCVRALVTASLQAGSYHDILSAESIRDARAVWQNNSGRFDLLLTDFSLPDGPAPEFIADILAQKPDLKVVLMSGLPLDALPIDPDLANHLHVLPKPFRPSELLSFLRGILPDQVAA